jgi:hypothetical protein
VSPDSDVIGTNYDGTTAGKKRPSARKGISPRNSLDRLVGRPWLAGLSAQAFSGLAAEAATTERVVVNRFTGLEIEGFDPSPILSMPTPR